VIVNYINALDYTVTVDVDWLSIVKNKNTVSITALKNTSDARTASVTFSITSVDGKTASTTVVINQANGAPSIKVMSGKNTNNPSIGNFTFISSTKTGTLTIRNTTTINTYYAYGSYAAVPYRVQCDAS
jgi:VCBS repeat-containing protein